MSSQLAITMARELLQEVEIKERLMMAETVRLIKLLTHKKRKGTIEFTIIENEPQVTYSDLHHNHFTVYSFSKIEHIAASFKLLQHHIKTGQKLEFYSSVEYGETLRKKRNP